ALRVLIPAIDSADPPKDDRIRPMPVCRVSILVPVVLLAGTMLAPTTASAARVQRERFSATLSATQSTTWTMNNPTGCALQTGSGSQKLKFHQRKKLTLVFSSSSVGGKQSLEVTTAPKPGDIAIAGEITQLGTVVVTSDPKCTVTGRPEGPAEPPPSPDCGSKRFTGTIRPTWSTPESYPELPDETPPLPPVFWLDEPLMPPLFSVCPYYGPLIAFRLTYDGLKPGKVFGPLPKLTLHDHAKKVNQYPNG